MSDRKILKWLGVYIVIGMVLMLVSGHYYELEKLKPGYYIKHQWDFWPTNGLAVQTATEIFDENVSWIYMATHGLGALICIYAPVIFLLGFAVYDFIVHRYDYFLKGKGRIT